MRAIEVESGETEPAPLKTILHFVRAPVLLIASGRSGELSIDEAFRARIPQATVWYLRDAGHTHGLSSRPWAYATHVTRFLRRALDLRS